MVYLVAPGLQGLRYGKELKGSKKDALLDVFQLSML